MKILFLLSSNRYSGAENVVCQIMSMFKNDADVEMIYCSPNGEIKKTLEEKSFFFFPLSDINVSEVKRAIKTLEPDIIHAHDMRASFIASLAAGRIPIISHIHNNAFDSRRVSPKSLAYIYAGMRSKHIFWVSQSSFEGYIFHDLFEKKSEILYNIIDIEALYEKMNLDENDYDYDAVYLGRLTYPKNPHRLMDVFSKVLERKNDAKFAVVGTGDLENEIKLLANKLNIDKQIDFFGFKHNPLKILYSSKVMVMTSRWEGTPMCALEALSLKVPIVSTPTDGLKIVVTDGKNGYLSDDDDILADKIVSIISNSDERNRMSIYAYQEACKLNNINMYKETLKRTYASVFK